MPLPHYAERAHDIIISGKMCMDCKHSNELVSFVDLFTLQPNAKIYIFDSMHTKSPHIFSTYT